MDCKHAYSLIQDFVDGALADEDRREFERHLSTCPACAREVETYRSLNAFLGDMSVEEPPTGLEVPVINFLKSTGRIREPATVKRGPRRVAAEIFGWIPAHFGVPVTVTTLALIAFSAFSIVTGRFQELVGRGAVLATDTYLGVQETVGQVQFLDKLGEIIARDFRMAKTIMGAGLSLVSTAGSAFVIPAVGLIVMLTIGFGWYFKTISKRSAQNASYTF
jgi:hypothetical protein